jgi:Na+/H+-dicarboxylate symporter
MKLWQKVTLGLVLGIITGILFEDKAPHLKPLGMIFLRLIKMIIIPLIFFSLVSGITSFEDPDSLGRVGMKATVAFLCTTCFAVIFGLGIALILKPGVGVDLDLSSVEPQEGPTKEFDIKEFFVQIVPENALKSFAEANLLQVVFFSIFTGVTINKMGSSANQIRNFCHIMSKLVNKMISMIILLSPLGAFALTAWLVSVHGTNVLLDLTKLVFAITIAMILQYFIFGVMIALYCGVSPIPFYKKSFTYQVMAFSTSSSKATLATSMEICRDELGVSEASTSFILPLGASINMDGFAINLGLTTIFFAQAFGIELAPQDYLVIVLTATLGSIGGAGIPGASLIMLPMVLHSVNLPLEGVAVIAGIDRILDMLRTTINITGDATITLLVDHSEGTFDKEKYYS